VIGPGPRLFCWRRRRLAGKASPGPLRRYLETAIPSVDADCRDTAFLALDLETTGLNPLRDQILSMGWVVMDGLDILLSTAEHHWVRPSTEIPESSAVVHRITDDQAARGDSLGDALARLLEALAGRVLLAHFATIELGFISRACLKEYGHPCLIPAVDTMQIARQQMEVQQEAAAGDGLRLPNLRRKHNLPDYRGHDALNDAVAAAELFAAQVAHLAADPPLPLHRVLYRPGAFW
jgi:DNA polymerase III subunit epsilon